MRNTQEAATLKSESGQKDCVHYWIIDFPDGPISTGRCKLCGMEREFFNCLDSIDLQNDDRYRINRNN
ncbi:MAG TPA: hypothetical protein G4O16_09905 [Dehalococcoidia bacterium]|nr:hypothetical protein [Dehalococcoidia bacterium]